MDSLERLGDSIRRVRKIRKMTQADLARAIAVQPLSVSQYETGRRNIRPLIQERIAKALSVPPSAFGVLADNSAVNWVESLKNLILTHLIMEEKLKELVEAWQSDPNFISVGIEEKEVREDVDRTIIIYLRNQPSQKFCHEINERLADIQHRVMVIGVVKPAMN